MIAVKKGNYLQIADKLETLITGYRYGRYCEDSSVSLEASHRFILDRVRKYLKNEDAQYFTAFDSSAQPQGILLFKLSQWDTDHFGYNVALVDSVIVKEKDYEQKLEITKKLLEKLNDWCRNNNIRFVSVRLPALDLPVIHGFEYYGFKYIESWIYNKYELIRVNKLAKTEYELRLAQPDDCRIMINYAKGAFVTQRFHADYHIAKQKADSLYEKWILTAFSDPNQEILVLDIENKPTAFMIYYKTDLRQYFNLQFAQWKMALIDPESRGQEVGTKFLIALAHHHRRDGLDVVDSGLSIRNLSSLNLHNKLNFRVVSTQVTLHKWLN